MIVFQSVVRSYSQMCLFRRLYQTLGKACRLQLIILHCTVSCTPSDFGLRADFRYRILSIFICRFMLRLRSVYIPADTQAASASFDSGPMVFSAVAGNMGAPLDVRLFGNDSGYDTGHEDEDEAILITVDPLGSPAGIEEEGL